MAASPEPICHGRSAIVKPSFIPEAAWCSSHELGNAIADFVLDAFDVYASGDFASWDKERARNIFWRLCKVNEKEAIHRRNCVCEYILVERMREREFFCCELCQESFFNYKQALIHFISRTHKDKETTAVKESRIDSVAKVLNTFTKIPEICASTDRENERRRFKINLSADFFFFAKSVFEKFHRDNVATLTALVTPEGVKSGTNAASSLLVATRDTVVKIKGEFGRNAMSELHEFLGTYPSYCAFCQFNTRQREEFYAHYTSYVHMRIVADHFKKGQAILYFDPLTILVNVHKKGLD